jgi:EAL domain-containing protein (putative c-di-GMP-specific phosphodiesterase class I)
LGFEISMAFQPVFDTNLKRIHSHEALVRGVNNESAATVFAGVGPHNVYQFDQACRVTAIKLAAQLEIGTFLNVNFMPNAVYRPERCIQTTLEAARTYGFPTDRIVFEITEGEKITDYGHLRAIVKDYNKRGFTVAIDDFGAGYAGLNLLANLQPDIVKLDMELIRNIDKDRVRGIIGKGIVQVSQELGIEIIAEGIERREELLYLQDLGVHLFQGFYIAKPSFESLADVNPVLFTDC